MPSIYRPDAFLFRQIHTHPLLVANDAGASSTDTIHRVRLKVEADLPQICAAFVNSLTFAWAEVCGRSYGGGVLELEPREADELPLPLPARLELDVDDIDDMLRAGRLVEALDTVDELLLHRLLGFSWATIGSVRRAWAHLRDRRTGRA